MKWSALEVGDVPIGVVTVTSTMPVPAGEVTVMEPAVSAVIVPGLALPKSTTVAFAKLVPVTVTMVPPATGPALGLTAATVGTAVYVKWSALDVFEVPPAVVTVMSCVPVPLGEVTVMEPAVSAVMVPGLAVPKSTAVALVRLLPVIVTLVPPPAGP